MRNPFKPSPAPPAFGAGNVVPENSASWLSQLVLQWLSPFLAVGFSRPLEKEDLWVLPDSRLTEQVTSRVEANFFSRCEPEKRPIHLRLRLSSVEGGSVDGTEQVKQEPADSEKTDPEAAPTSEDPPPPERDNRPQYDESLFKALHRTFIVNIWTAGILNFCAETLRTTTPLLNKVLLTWLTESYIYVRLNETERGALGLHQPRGIGYGIGLAIALFAMQESASLMTNHYMKIAMATGMSIRSGVVGNVFRKSLRISGRARLDHSVGQIFTMISTDATNLEMFSAFAHSLWIAPIQLILGIGLLIGTLGYSALVGLGVVIFGFPLQFILVKIMFTQRNKGVKITDKRVQLTTEVLQGIRLIKFYAWEQFYIQQIGNLREREIRTIRKSSVALSLLLSVFTLTPVLAAVLSFITYALSGHDLNVAVIFTSLQLFNIIRIPLLMLPLVLSSFSQALIALGRISKFLAAEELPEPYLVEPESGVAVRMEGDFTWESVLKTGKQTEGKFDTEQGEANGKSGAKQKSKDGKSGKDDPPEKTADSFVLPSTTADVVKVDEKEGSSTGGDDKPFELKNLNVAVPKGAFVGIVGRVGSGKTSVLQAMIGEMRKTQGEVVFGGSVAYVPQIPWIRNATVRENVTFGQEDDEDRFRDIIRACSLEHDLEMLPYGESTEIGEKGINLSGGQKARISLARAAYSQSDIILLDDPLSAVDAYVGKSILDNCILSGPLAARTRILVTHSLHVLDKMDYIYVMGNGVILEQGTYEELIASGDAFSRLMEEYGGTELEKALTSPGKQKKQQTLDGDSAEGGDKALNDVLMQLEERNTGAVTWNTYKKYLWFAGGIAWAPVIIFLLAINQAASVGDNLFLGLWTAHSIPGFKEGHYMAVYAAFGVGGAIFVFALSFAFFIVGLVASLRLFKAALSGILHSPLSFFDTTPMGRILSRLSKDQETLDNELAPVIYSFLSIFTSVFGVAALVFYTFPYLGIIFVPLTILYYFVGVYYRHSSVETKRLDSILRSSLYASVSETLTGLSTVRAYRMQNASTQGADRGLDVQNRAYYMTVTIQRWLGIRLDFFGNLVVLGIGLFAAGFRHTVNPAKIGVVLSYTLGITQVFSEMISQFAQNEQNMNAVERVLHYAELTPEADALSPTNPPPSWPSNGEIKFMDVELAYREGLPLVLKGISFQVNTHEKIGIVGRTGAGKSSLLQALFRTVELRAGRIEIDGIDIQTIPLQTLRSRLALVPQDSILFLGTLRENLDPQGLRTDAELISVLQRAWLLPRDGSSDPVAEAKFSLESTVGDEGANYSAGEKQLLALCRALVKNSQIIILDEATSNVDVETDSKLQRTIQTEFASSTLLCIAHRLNTIAYYDRVLVMDGGKVAEFDTVLNLFDRTDSIFRSLCDEANLQRVDILRIRAEHGPAVVKLPE